MSSFYVTIIGFFQLSEMLEPSVGTAMKFVGILGASVLEKLERPTTDTTSSTLREFKPYKHACSK